MNTTGYEFHCAKEQYFDAKFSLYNPGSKQFKKENLNLNRHS